MGSDKYRLKWSKYENNILDAFRSLLETEALSDVTLFCEGIPHWTGTDLLQYSYTSRCFEPIVPLFMGSLDINQH